MSKNLVASYRQRGQKRWRWALYRFKYAGYGFRCVRVRDDTFRRWRMFVDIPLFGGFSLYIQDVP